MADRRAGLLAGAVLRCAVTLGVMSSGCGSVADASLTVSASGLTLKKSMDPFGAKLQGQVTVTFDLGHYTGSPVQIQSIFLGLYQGTSTTQVLSRAKFIPADPVVTLPLTLSPGETRAITYTISGEQLQPGEVATICGGPISVSGTAQQTGRATPYVLTTGVVSAQGCP